MRVGGLADGAVGGLADEGPAELDQAAEGDARGVRLAQAVARLVAEVDARPEHAPAAGEHLVARDDGAALVLAGHVEELHPAPWEALRLDDGAVSSPVAEPLAHRALVVLGGMARALAEQARSIRRWLRHEAGLQGAVSSSVTGLLADAANMLGCLVARGLAKRTGKSLAACGWSLRA